MNGMRQSGWYRIGVFAGCIVLAGGLAGILFGGINEYWVWGICAAGAGVSWIVMGLGVWRQYKQAKRERLVWKRENEKLKRGIEVMRSQIHPHFLYNVLMSVEALCKRDPAGAQAAVQNFSHYLRGSLDALDGVKMIAFKVELDHIRHYLELEKMRFEERLSVEYDLQVLEFGVPALTVLFLVENGVRHGITKKKGGGTLWIGTRVHNDCVMITVKDDGKGYDNIEKEMANHWKTGLEYIRNELGSQCGGTLLVESGSGMGTKAEIAIPREV